MIQIANVPYQKTYRFSYISDAMALKVILYALALLLPFFMVYSVNNFYLTFVDSVTVPPTISYTYNYHITVETSSAIYTFTTLYKSKPTLPISISYEANQNKYLHKFAFNIPKPVDEKIKKVNTLLFLSYSTSTITDAFGLVYSQGSGYDLADLASVGVIQIAAGQNLLADPPVTNLFVENGYDYSVTSTALMNNYRAYLKSSTSYLTSNMPNNLFKYSLSLKTPSASFQVQSASVLGQLIWSFTQYFPIAFVFFFAAKSLLTFLLRENMIKRAVLHDTIN